MSSAADLQSHLSSRRQAIGELFDQWGSTLHDPSRRTETLSTHLKQLDIGQVIDFGDTDGVHVAPLEPLASRPQVLVVGRHDTADLAPGDHPTATESALVGPGIASRVGPTVAFAEAVAFSALSDDSPPVDVHIVSTGQEQNPTAAVIAAMATAHDHTPLDRFDAVYLTNAVTWDPFQPTQTVGARGRLVADLRLGGVRPTHDFTTSGALRNPLTSLTQIMGRLRDDRGRITIPDFYDRAEPPSAGERNELQASGFDPSAWADKLRSSRPSGSLSSIERATMWPGVSVLDISCDPNGRDATPTWAAATVAFYLVPDQRHADIERSLRTWFADAAPPDLTAGVRILESSRPFRAPVDDPAVAAQRRALETLRGPRVVPVPGGGMPGAGEIAYAVNAPVAFAGIARPSNSWGSINEALAWSEFDAGVELAVATCRHLARQ